MKLLIEHPEEYLGQIDAGVEERPEGENRHFQLLDFHKAILQISSTTCYSARAPLRC